MGNSLKKRRFATPHTPEFIKVLEHQLWQMHKAGAVKITISCEIHGMITFVELEMLRNPMKSVEVP